MRDENLQSTSQFFFCRTIKADWIQLPVEQYLAALPTLRHGVIAGVFRNKLGVNY